MAPEVRRFSRVLARLSAPRSARGLALAVLLPLAGCQPSPEDLINQGRAAIGQRRFDVAHAKFDEVLKQQPESYEAQWGKATILEQQGKFGEQAAMVRAMLAKPALASKYGDALKPALETAIRRQAEQAASDEEKEKLLRQAIELNEKSAAVAALAKHFIAKGDAATKRDDPVAAEAAYRAVETLKVGKKVAREARTKAELAGFMVYKRESGAKLEGPQNELAQAGQFDAAGEKFMVEGTADAQGDAKAEDFEANAEKAALAAARVALEDLTVKLSAKPRPEGASLAYDEALLSVEEKGWAKKNKTYRVKVSLPRDAVLFKLFELERGLTTRPADDGGDDDAPAAPASEGAPPAAPASEGGAASAPAPAEAPKAP